MSLSDFYENNMPVVEYGGDFFWVGDDPPPDWMQTEEADFEAADVPAIRRSVGVGVLTEGIHSGNCDGVYDGGRYVNDTGFLPDKATRIYRIVKNKQSFHPDDSVKPYHVYSLEEQAWFCVRQGCYDCPDREVCEVGLVERPAEMSVVNIDVSSQEPMLNTFLSKEPRWLEIFRNRHLRELGLTHYLDLLLTEQYGVDPDSHSAEWYWRWLDRNFHGNYEDLVVFNRLVDRWRAGEDVDVWSEVAKMMESMAEAKGGK